MGKPRHPMTPREIVRLLAADGWTIKRKGPGDHVQYAHTTKPGKVTVDVGVRVPDKSPQIDVPTGWLGVVSLVPASKLQDCADAPRLCSDP